VCNNGEEEEQECESENESMALNGLVWVLSEKEKAGVWEEVKRVEPSITVASYIMKLSWEFA
jgi:hypothetical protein